MVFVDHIKGDHEEILLRKIAIGLGFSPKNAKYVVDKALSLVSDHVDSGHIYSRNKKYE